MVLGLICYLGVCHSMVMVACLLTLGCGCLWSVSLLHSAIGWSAGRSDCVFSGHTHFLYAFLENTKQSTLKLFQTNLTNVITSFCDKDKQGS